MTTATSSDLLVNLLRRVTGSQITPSDYVTLNPIVVASGPTNTKIKFQARAGSGKYAIQEFNYNRINLSAFAPVRVRRGSAVNISDIIDKISEAAQLGSFVNVSSEPSITDYQIVRLTLADIVDSALPTPSGSSMTAAVLNSHINSPVFVGSLPIVLIEVLPEVPAIKSFAVSPPWGLDGEGFRLSSKIAGLTPNTVYILAVCRQQNTGSSTYHTDFIETSYISSDSNGVIDFVDYKSWLAQDFTSGQMWVGIYDGAVVPLGSANTDTTGVLALVKTGLVQHDRLTTPIANPTTFFTRWNAGTDGVVVYNKGRTARALSAFKSIRAMQGVSSGKWFWQLKATNAMGMAGVSRITEFLNYYLGSGPFGWGLGGAGNQAAFNNSISTAFANSWNKSVTVGLYLNMNAGTLGAIVGGIDIGIIFSGITGKVYPSASGCSQQGVSVTVNFGDTAMEGTVPGGYPPGVYSSTFLPSILPGLKGWFDSEDYDTITVVNDHVSRWGDKSGAGNHAIQTDPTKRYQSIDVSGAKQLQNDGVSSYMDIPNVLLPAKHNYAFAVVSNQGTTTVLGSNAAGNNFYFGMSSTFGGSVQNGRVDQVIALIGAGIGITNGSKTLMSTFELPVESMMRAGPSARGYSIARDITINQLTGNGTAGSYLSGAIHEIIFGDELLTRAQAQMVYDYLSARWGV